MYAYDMISIFNKQIDTLLLSSKKKIINFSSLITRIRALKEIGKSIFNAFYFFNNNQSIASTVCVGMFKDIFGVVFIQIKVRNWGLFLHDVP